MFKVVGIINVEDLPDKSARIEEMGGEFVKKECQSEQEIITIAGDADYILTVGHRRPVGRAVIEKLAKCRFIQTIGIGYDGIDVEAATENGIGVVNVPEYCTEEVSDHIMALILSCSRRIMELNSLVKGRKLSGSFEELFVALKRIWFKMDHLRGKTLGFVGFGRIPRATVPKAKGFGMNILAYDPYVPQSICDRLGVQMMGLEEVLGRSDFISVNVSLTPETRHLIGLEQLRKMKPTAYLINTSRGPIIDTEALQEALSRSYIAGAGLDVTDPEPLPPNNPLVSVDNVVLTGHSAHASSGAWAELWERPFEEVARVIDGEWPQGLVNPEVKQKKNCRGPVSKI